VGAFHRGPWICGHPDHLSDPSHSPPRPRESRPLCRLLLLPPGPEKEEKAEESETRKQVHLHLLFFGHIQCFYLVKQEQDKETHGKLFDCWEQQKSQFKDSCLSLLVYFAVQMNKRTLSCLKHKTANIQQKMPCKSNGCGTLNPLFFFFSLTY